MELLTYQPDTETEVVPETEPRPLRGEAVYLIHLPTGRIRVGKELTDKPATGRIRGQWTIPIETPKRINGVPEETEDTARGALPEVLHDVDTLLQPVPLAEYLHVLDGFSHHNGIHTTIKGRPVTVGYTTVIWDGPEIPMASYNCLEVDEPRWEYPEVILQGNVRLLAGQIIEDALTRGIHQETIERFIDQPQLRRPLLPPDFSLREHYLQRERYPDIT